MDLVDGLTRYRWEFAVLINMDTRVNMDAHLHELTMQNGREVDYGHVKISLRQWRIVYIEKGT